MKKNLLISSFVIFIAVLTILYSAHSNLTSSYIISLLLTNIIPSLLPFMIIIQFLIAFKGIDYLAYLFQWFSSKIFHISGYGLIAIFSTFLGGFPYGIIIISQFVKENKISKEEAQKLSNFIYFPSFSFLYSTLCFFNSTHRPIILKIMIILYSLSFLFLLIFPNKSPITKIKKEDLFKNETSFINAYNQIIQNTCFSLVNISLTICIFYLLKTAFQPLLTPNLYFLLGSLLEFSSTSLEILSLTTLNISHILFLTFSLSFCGLSFFFQSLPYIKKANLNVKEIIFFRFVIAFLSCLCVYFF